MKNSPHKTILLGQVIGKYLTNSESDRENKILDSWINEGSKNKELLNSISSNEKLIEEYETMDLFHKEKALERIKEKILLRSKTRALVRWQIAASILVLVGIFGVLYFLSGNFSKTIEKPDLYTSVSTENGQRSKVVLPDSSIVWLNSGTTLSYPNDFSHENRKVLIKGQAFFEVTHQSDYPFSVRANDLIVSVLGTKFDINAYPEEDKIAVVLESGKIKLTHKEFDSFSYTMKPGEKATFNLANNSSMSVSPVESSVYSSWKEGKLIFRYSTMENVVAKLRRWYNIDIDISDPEINNSIFSGTIMNESYEEIFRLIGKACHVDCKIIHNYEKEAKPQIIISNK